MRRVLNLAFIYAVVGMMMGVYYRELSRFMDYEGGTVLGGVHSHILALGMSFMLIVLVLMKVFPLDEIISFRRFLLIYNGSFIWSMMMMTVRGTLEVMELSLSAGMDGMIAGLAGLGHIGVFIGIIFLFRSLRSVVGSL